eukprot:8944526-Alexandrium_andersonii.AAC.1
MLQWTPWPKLAFAQCACRPAQAVPDRDIWQHLSPCRTTPRARTSTHASGAFRAGAALSQHPSNAP